jgi:predicted amidohydrolase YtcJ
MLLANANVLTLDPAQPRVDELVIRDGRIDLAGSAIGERVDLGGATVVPGFVDSHTHFRAWAVARHRLDLHDATDLGELLIRVLGATGDGVLGAGWSDTVVAPHGRIVDALVDAADGRFVALMSRDSHALLTTEATLEQLGLTLADLDVSGGVVERDGEGAFTGVLREESAWMVRRRLPDDDIDDRVMADGVSEAARRGVTSLHDMDGGAALGAWRSLEATHGLDARVHVHLLERDLPHAVALGLGAGFGSDRLRIGGLKLFVDGTLGSGTALLHAPEHARPGEEPRTGVEMVDGDELRRLAIEAAALGMPLLVHAIGDRAFTQVVDALEATVDAWTHLSMRPRIEHAQLVRHDDLVRCARLGIALSVQPSMLVADRDEADARWGERTARAFAYRWMLDAGCRLLLNSDAPIEEISPLAAMHAATTRDGGAHGLADARGPWHAEQAIDPMSALLATSAWPAEASGLGDRLGQLTPGRLADLVVLNGDPLTTPIASLDVVATMVGGVWTFGG